MKQPHPDSAVAVVGMACRLPGADDLDQFWDLVRRGGVAWGPVPDDRLNRRLYYHPKRGTRNKTYSDVAALVAYRPVDRGLCPISESAIASHDVAHVTLCEVAAAACRHAGLDPAALPYDNTGVYVGHAAASGVAAELTYATYVAQTAKYLREAVGFEQLADGLGDEVIAEIIDAVRRDRPRRDRNGGPFFGASMAARLIARTFALNGPCMSFNAACASSSRALGQAVRALQHGTVDMAIVGGASFFHSDTLVLFAQSHSLSPSASRPFSAEADGMIVGEGYVVTLLKMLRRAEADGDRILAVIPGIGISSDGRGKSLWAPRHEGQIKAIQRAYGPEVAMDRLQYIEAHATSTFLGDVTEVTALTAALEGRLAPGTKLPAGSAKLNVAHTLESAGLVGVVRTVLALEHEVIPPAIDDRPLNPQIDWDKAPIYVPRHEVAWPRRTDAAPRRAGVDAFGIGGLNVHVVVDDYVPSRASVVPGADLPAQTLRTPRGEDDGAVAVIGMGAVMPGALTLDAFWDLLAAGRDATSELPDGRWDSDAFYRPGATGPWETPTKRGGYVTGFEYDWRKHKIPPKEIAQASPLQFMILDAVDQAIHRAKYHERPFDRERVGVVVGTVFGGDCAAELAVSLRLPEFQETLAGLLRAKGVPEDLIGRIAQSYGEVLLKHMPILLDETGSFTASALASRITKSFDLMGGAVAVDAGQASALAALSCCVDQLRGGDCDMMICVGGQQDMTPTIYEEWSICGRLPVGEPRSPFDARADGVLPAEGCGALLLKRLGDARRDGDPIFGIIRGVGAACDPSRSEAARLAAGRALDDARVSPDDVALIETSTSGKPDADAGELRGVAEAYGDGSRPGPMWLATAVGRIGDTGGASGMASLLKAAMELDTLQISPDPRLEHPAPQLTRHAAVLAVPSHPTPISARAGKSVLAGVHSGGDGEVTYHVVFERGTKVKPTSPTPQSTAQPKPQVTRGASRIASPIPHFDATARRREKMRQKARTAPQPAPAVAEPPSRPAVAPSMPPVASGATAAPAVRPAQPAGQRVAPTSTPVAAPQAASAVARPSPGPAPTESAGLDSKELEQFLVNFVVEHTGYPAEIVELDADLEADLGIDSIKKAQLFGELGEYFDVQPSEDLSLDDFPTLRHVLDYLVKSQGAGAAPAPQAVSQPAPAPAPEARSQPAPSVAPTASTEAPSAGLDPNELERFLVNFVVEHTGYPAEIVELDADLEADLGIDSIKKAQLFGELGEYFDVQPSEDLSLDDFPTLRHVLDYLVKSQGAARP